MCENMLSLPSYMTICCGYNLLRYQDVNCGTISYAKNIPTINKLKSNRKDNSGPGVN